jgi:beta-glucosidase
MSGACQTPLGPAALLQIEGGVTSGGRTESIWDNFTKQPGKIHASATGNTATDHYHKWVPSILN